MPFLLRGEGCFRERLVFCDNWRLLTMEMIFLNSATGAYSGPRFWACVICRANRFCSRPRIPGDLVGFGNPRNLSFLTCIRSAEITIIGRCMLCVWRYCGHCSPALASGNFSADKYLPRSPCLSSMPANPLSLYSVQNAMHSIRSCRQCLGCSHNESR